MRLGLVAGTILAIGDIAVAYSSDAVPDLNIERYCNYTADRNQVEPDKRGAFVSKCKIEDEAAIPLVNLKWQFVPTNIQGECLDVAHDSYAGLNRCLDEALDAYPTSIPHTDVSEGGGITQRFWTVDECLRQRPEGAVCVAH